MIKEPKSMREIHEIMEKMYRRRKGMSENEILRDIKNAAESAEKKYGLQLKKIKHVSKAA